jgi:hypothetical protein
MASPTTRFLRFAKGTTFFATCFRRRLLASFLSLARGKTNGNY